MGDIYTGLSTDWSKSHCGVMLMAYEEIKIHMPEVIPYLQDLISTGKLQYDISQYLIDVKVHMLMPNQYPCIPDWHCDFVPRTPDNTKKLPHLIDDSQLMYLWVSNAPYTEFKNEPETIVTGCRNKWIVMNQRSVHRGTMSQEHCWRCFIRLVPLTILGDRNVIRHELRRHSQVYLDANNYSW